MNSITLRQAVYNNVKLSEKHVANFKQMFLKGMRSPRRKYQIERVTVEDLPTYADKWWATRITFFADGSCRYFAGQDHQAEITQIRDEIVGFKK